MLRFTHKLPDIPYTVAVSGGPDSMAVLDFLCGHKIKPKVAYFNHGTEHGLEAEEFVKRFCEERKLAFAVGRIRAPKEKGESPEEFWRERRLAFLQNLGGPVITAHNLNDVVETWIFTSLHGNPKLLPYQNQNIIRPFRATPKSEFVSWCERHNVPYLNDPSNLDTKYIRNHIRHKLMPEALIVNPGLEKVIKKKVLENAASQAPSSLPNPPATLPG